MCHQIAARMRDAVRARQYIMTLHAEEEMNDDNLSIFDVERVLLKGEIIEQQKDKTTFELKYLIEGESIASGRVVVVTKFSVTGKLVIITVYKA